jgi:prophage regulatory protein
VRLKILRESSRRQTEISAPGTKTADPSADPDCEQVLERRSPEKAPHFTRTIRRAQLREIVPLADTTIYELEQRGEFPRRFYLTARCVVWDLAEIEAWIEKRRRTSNTDQISRAPFPDVRRRKARPVRPVHGV